MRLTAGSVTDGINNGPTNVLNSNMVTVDQVAPSVTIASPPANSKLRSLSYTADFSEIVTEISASDFIQHSGTASCSTVSASQASGQSVTFSVLCSTDGTVVMKFISNSVTDGLYTGPDTDVLTREVAIDSSVALIITPRALPRTVPPALQPVLPNPSNSPRTPTLIRGELPRVTTTESVVIVGGSTTTVESTILPTGGQQISLPSGASVVLESAGQTTSNQTSSGVMQLRQGENLVVRVSGLKPGSEIEVWLFSTPKLLGTMLVGSDGTVSAEFAIPADLELGSHTAQIDAIDPSGASLTVNAALQLSAEKTKEASTNLHDNVGSQITLISVAVAALTGFGLLIWLILYRRRSREDFVD
jgi:hypothetical protein